MIVRKHQNLILTIDGVDHHVRVREKIPGQNDVLVVTIHSQQYDVRVKVTSEDTVPTLEIEPVPVKPMTCATPVPAMQEHHQKKWKAAEIGIIPAPISGRIIEVKVKIGDIVKAGDVLVILEAMKMHNEVTAPRAGRIRSIVVEGALMNFGDDIAIID
ncbi:MAG: acetyl-CoA carboxylase biotin carboxyl carrier protein [Candidatus Heimdallarchaeota archaeon]